MTLCTLVALPIDAQGTLREATKGKFLMGVAVNSAQIAERDPVESQIIRTEFSSIVAENCMKSALIHPEENRYNFDEPDRFVALGEKTNKR